MHRIHCSRIGSWLVNTIGKAGLVIGGAGLGCGLAHFWGAAFVAFLG